MDTLLMSPRWVSPASPSLVYMRVRLTVMVEAAWPPATDDMGSHVAP